MSAPPILVPRAQRTEAATFPLSATQQRFLGYFFVFHGLAHAGIGIWAAETGRWWVAASLWELAMVGFIAAGFGALGVAGLRDLWRALTLVAASASILLFLSSPHTAFLFGLGADIMSLALVAYSRSAPAVETGLGKRNEVEKSSHKIRRLVGIVIAWLIIAYVAVVIALRPWNVQWGTTASERAMPLPGDQFAPIAHYRIDHGITINAPRSMVWPWLIQIGQDRGGFYSYSALENAIGARVTNAQTLVPEWQSRHVGELVRAVPEDWMGGRFGTDIGWRILQLIPGRAIVLENWGAFVLLSVNDTTTRLLVRTRGPGLPSERAVPLSPLGLLVFEPAHLIMERRMLLGIRERAERGWDKAFFLGSVRGPIDDGAGWRAAFHWGGRKDEND